MIDPNLHIWLAYSADPQTTASYLERALRKLCRVTTIGPSITEESLNRMNLNNVGLIFGKQDIETSQQPDMAHILSTLSPTDYPDVFIWVESTIRFLPHNLQVLKCPKVCYLIDSHLHLDFHVHWRSFFDYAFVVHLNQLGPIRKSSPKTYWLPVACDPSVHSKWDVAKKHDMTFVGSFFQNPEREALIERIRESMPINIERCFLEQMARVFSESRMVLNQARDHDLNMRFFETLSTGSLLLSDLAKDSGQDVMFRDGEDFACYNNENIIDIARFYLENERLCEQVAARGRMLVHNAHTYEHRVKDMLNVVLNGKPDTFAPEELRERSLCGVPELYNMARESIQVNCATRSFVIPVLDYSPASEYSILTLLRDLEEISGEVIVIFNSEDVANELKGHSRINHYAVMKHNVGVSRAWNIGLDIAETPTVFIVNADAHITANAVDLMELELNRLDKAACVGPQGSFVNFSLCRDYHYFDKGSFSTPVEVDAVSGFFFAVKRELFENKTLNFENSYTPCYFEEWDLGLQIRLAGFKSYVVSTVAYDHHWSGSIRALRTIPYYGRDETAGDILKRNRLLFVTKWREIARLEDNAWLLDGGWKVFGRKEVERCISAADYAGAVNLLRSLAHDYPEDPAITALSRFVTLQAGKTAVMENLE